MGSVYATLNMAGQKMENVIGDGAPIFKARSVDSKCVFHPALIRVFFQTRSVMVRWTCVRQVKFIRVVAKRFPGAGPERVRTRRIGNGPHSGN